MLTEDEETRKCHVKETVNIYSNNFAFADYSFTFGIPWRFKTTKEKKLLSGTIKSIIRLFIMMRHLYTAVKKISELITV